MREENRRRRLTGRCSLAVTIRAMSEIQKPLRLGPHAVALPVTRAIGRKSAPFEDVYHSVLTASWWRFFAMVAVVFLAANGLFAFAYAAQPGSIANARSGSLEDAFFFSVQTMATIG